MGSDPWRMGCMAVGAVIATVGMLMQEGRMPPIWWACWCGHWWSGHLWMVGGWLMRSKARGTRLIVIWDSLGAWSRRMARDGIATTTGNL